MSKFVINKYSLDKKSLSILFNFLIWLILGLIICFIGISKTNALVIDSKFLGYSNNGNFGISAGNYISGNSFITVDQSNALNYYVVDMCTTLNNLFSITNITNQSGNVSLYKTYSYLGSCNTDNYTGQLARIYFKINEWADAGNGNFGVIFSLRLNNTASYYGDNKIINIYTTNEIDNTSEIINNQTNELNNSINNSTNTITGSIGDTENNINQNIDDMESAIVDSNKETQNVIKDQFNTCRDSYNLLNNLLTTQTKNGITLNVNDDKSITLNGTSSSTTLFYITKDTWGYNSQSTILEAGTYTFKNIGTSYSRARLFIDAFNTSSARIYGTQSISNNNLTFTLNEKASLNIRLEIPNGVTFNNQKMYFQIQEGSGISEYEPYGEEICSNKIDETNNQLGDLNSSLNNSDSSGATNDASNFFSNFTTDTFGLTSIITAPLNIINSITSSSCNDLNLPLPYLDNKYITLPCMNSIYTRYFGVFFNLYQTITFGIVSYWVIVRIFNQVKDFKNPEHDEIEVLDL